MFRGRIALPCQLRQLVHFVSMLAFCGLVLLCTCDRVLARTPTDAEVLSEKQWRELDDSVEKSLHWMQSQQQRDGSFPTLATGQPGVTSLCVMAFLAHGNLPGSGEYGETLNRALRFILKCQKQNGLVALVAPNGTEISRNVGREVGTSAAYNHAISSLILSELYGMGEFADSKDLEEVIQRSLQASLAMQAWPKDMEADRGGWRYLDEFDAWDSDVSITGWELMFLRSAKNDGFDVPTESIDQAVGYIRRAFSNDYGTFEYIINDADTRSRAMAGAGILALAHAGQHDTPEAKRAAEWVLQQRFDRYNVIETFGQAPYAHDRYHYAVFNSCQGMYQMGGRYWKEFFPKVVQTLIENQNEDGSWDRDSHQFDRPYGNAYTTALMTIALGAPNQLLPIFQR